MLLQVRSSGLLILNLHYEFGPNKVTQSYGITTLKQVQTSSSHKNFALLHFSIKYTNIYLENTLYFMKMNVAFPSIIHFLNHFPIQHRGEAGADLSCLRVTGRLHPGQVTSVSQWAVYLCLYFTVLMNLRQRQN